MEGNKEKGEELRKQAFRRGNFLLPFSALPAFSYTLLSISTTTFRIASWVFFSSFFCCCLSSSLLQWFGLLGLRCNGGAACLLACLLT